MLTIPYLGFETFKNYTLLGDTYLSSPCILIKVTMLMFCRSWCTLSLQDNSRSKMLTIPYLGFETFTNYTLPGDTYLSSPCILIKVMMLMFCRSWFGAEKYVIQISWFLVLLWGVKVCFLRNDVFYCIFIQLHGP